MLAEEQCPIASALHAIGTPAAGTAFPPLHSSSSAVLLHHHRHHRQIPRPSPPLSLSYDLPFPSSASAFLVPVLRIATYDLDVTAQIAPSTDVSDVPTFPLNTKKKCSGERKEGLLWQLHVLPTYLCCPTRQPRCFSFSGLFVSRVLSNRGQSHQHRLYSQSGMPEDRSVSLRIVVLRLV